MPTVPPRPVFLDLRRIRLPVNALVSILHRVSGVLLILLLPLGAWLLVTSLHDDAGYHQTRAWLAGPGGWLALAGLWALAHHLFAGLRHLALDLGRGLGRTASRRSAWGVLAADVLVVPLLWGVLP